IRRHLRPYSIANRRRTTINHAFASAIAQYDEFDQNRVESAMRELGLDSRFLACAYCESRKATAWDHLVGLVKDGRYSGYGHVLGNLIPCCGDCNSEKGNKDWKMFLRSKIPDNAKSETKIALIDRY